jgi:hypothetical protein
MGTTWERALKETCFEHKDERLDFGLWDCCQFVREYALRLTGVDYAEKFHLEYKDEDGANRILAQHGGLVGLLTHVLGPPLTGPVSPGDIVVVDLLGTLAAGVWCGEWAILILPERGSARARVPVVARWSCQP